MIGFNDELAKHAFFTELDADKQVAFTKFYEALVMFGFDMHVVVAQLNEKGKLEVVIRVHDQT